MDKIPKYNIILFGNLGVGKTSLVERYINNRFQENYVSMIGYNVYEKEIQYETHSIIIMIYDVGGQEEFRNLRMKYAEGAQSAILIYDITDKDSFKKIEMWRNDLIEFAGNIPYVIIGNKIDLKNKRVVSYEELSELATQLKAIDFFETSAKTGEGVEYAFNKLAIKLYEIYSTEGNQQINY
ncbi:MAG: Rab family GTPase [Candidatus Helarchaeota archaeon]